jgi:hypothetical protein
VAVATPGDDVQVSSTGPPGPRLRVTDQWAFLAFAVVAVVSIPLLLRLGHDRWFQFDDWDFLASRDAGNLHELFEPHGPHWSTLPILVYRIEWYLFALHDYWPYQLVCVLSHLTVAVLIRTVMRRAGVRPWVATATVLPLLFFGAGEENIAYAFQINFNASLVFGLVHPLLADHDGPVDRRDGLALLAGFAGLMSSGIAVTMVVVVGLAMLVRRGWRVALLHTAPLGVAYLVWYATIAREGYQGQDVSDPIDALAFARTTIAAGFGGLAQVPGLGWVLGGLVVGGLLLAWRRQSWGQVRRVAAAPAALAAGAFVFALITSLGRHSLHLHRRSVAPAGGSGGGRCRHAPVASCGARVPGGSRGLASRQHPGLLDERPYSGKFLANYRTSSWPCRGSPSQIRYRGPATGTRPCALRVARLAAGRGPVRQHSTTGRHGAESACHCRGTTRTAGAPWPPAGRV